MVSSVPRSGSLRKIQARPRRPRCRGSHRRWSPHRARNRWIKSELAEIARDELIALPDGRTRATRFIAARSNTTVTNLCVRPSLQTLAQAPLRQARLSRAIQDTIAVRHSPSQRGHVRLGPAAAAESQARGCAVQNLAIRRYPPSEFESNLGRPA